MNAARTKVQTEQEAHLALSRAQVLLNGMLEAARTANPKRRKWTLVMHEFTAPAPYAKEARLIASAVGRRHNVFVAGVTDNQNRYRNGYPMIVVGYAQDVTAALAAYETTWEAAKTGMAASEPREGEDRGTHVSSWLLGFHAGLLGGPVLERDELEARIAAPLPKDGWTRMRSTGTGAWAGYLAGRAWTGDGPDPTGSPDTVDGVEGAAEEVDGAETGGGEHDGGQLVGQAA